MTGSEDISKELEAIEDDVDNDFFEEALKQELKIPTDDDDADASAAKEAEEDVKKEEEEDPAVLLKTANDKIAELELQAKGRLSDTVKSRQEKSAMKAELTELKSAVSSLLEKRDDAGKKEDEKPLLEETKIGVEFDEDDKAFVDLKDVKEKIETDNKPLREELETLKADKALVEQKAAFKKAADEIISEDQKAFDPAFPILRDAFKDLNDAVIALQNRLEIMDDDGSIQQDEALDLLRGTEELKGFTDKYPGIDPIKVARAFNSNVDFRSGLRNIANVNKFGLSDNDDKATGIEAKLDEKIKAAKDKPGSLAGSSDQAGGTADLLSRIAAQSTEEILSYSDSEIDKIEAVLEKEARGE